MKKLIYIALITALISPLAACATTGTGNVTPVVTRDVNHVIEPPTVLFYCPQLSKLPDPTTLTNRDLANLITTLMKDNQTCGYNMVAIQNFIKKAKAVIEAENAITVKSN